MQAAISSALRKICVTCGRQISPRKKWKKNWESIIYCSDSCKKHKIRPNSLDTAFESKILSLLAQRRAMAGSKAVVTCEEAESEVLREEMRRREEMEASDSSAKKEPGRLREVRERCRQAARRLAARGEVVVTQDGKDVDPSFAKGVMELKFPT